MMDKKPKKKFTATQQTVIDLLSEGGELGVKTDHHTSTPRTRHWVQEGKIGDRSKMHKVTAATVTSLKELGVIKKVERNPYLFDAIYELDREGLAALGHPAMPAADGA
jgi:hypothetical protein